MKNEKKQTAVEWLQSELERIDKEEYYESIEYINARKKAFEQAKEMEKEQMIDAFGVGCHLESKRLIGYHDVAEQYYNETYGGNK